MAAVTYLGLCQAFVEDVGINAGQFSAVTSTNILEAKVARWIRSADLWIQDELISWPWLWRQVSGTLASGSATIARPTDLKEIVKDSLVFDKGLTTAQRCQFMPWPHFRNLYEFSAKIDETYPSYFSVSPDATASFVLSSTPDDSTITYDFEYYRTPVPMENDASVPAMGVYGEQETQRVIIARAKIMYGASENAPEIQAEGAAEYEDYIGNMMEKCFPENQIARSMGDDLGYPPEGNLAVWTP